MCDRLGREILLLSMRKSMEKNEQVPRTTRKILRLSSVLEGLTSW